MRLELCPKFTLAELHRHIIALGSCDTIPHMANLCLSAFQPGFDPRFFGKFSETPGTRDRSSGCFGASLALLVGVKTWPQTRPQVLPGGLGIFSSHVLLCRSNGTACRPLLPQSLFSQSNPPKTGPRNHQTLHISNPPTPHAKSTSSFNINSTLADLTAHASLQTDVGTIDGSNLGPQKGLPSISRSSANYR